MSDFLEIIDDLQLKMDRVSALLHIVSDHHVDIVTDEDVKNRTPSAYNMAYNSKDDGIMIEMVWDIAIEVNDKLSELYKIYKRGSLTGC